MKTIITIEIETEEFRELYEQDDLDSLSEDDKEDQHYETLEPAYTEKDFHNDFTKIVQEELEKPIPRIVEYLEDDGKVDEIVDDE